MQQIKRRPFIAGLVLGAIHAVLFGIAFPPIGAWTCSLAAAIPLALLAWHTSSPRRSALGVMLATMPMWGYHQFWMSKVSAAGMPVFMVYLAAFSGLYVYIAARLHRRWPRIPAPLLIAITWIGVEFFRGEIAFDGYAWYLLAHPLIDLPLIPQAAATLGAYGLGMILAAFAGVVVALSERKWLAAAIAAFVTSTVFAGAALLAPRPAPSQPARISAVQMNIPQDNKMAWTIDQRIKDFSEFLAMTDLAVAQKPDIIAWPETMFPGSTLSPQGVEAERASGLGFRGTDLTLTSFHDALIETQASHAIPMLVGSRGTEGLRIVTDEKGTYEKTDAEFNSAFLIAGGKVADARYDKMFLTPFGEVMPYISLWPWLERQLLALGAGGMTFDLSAGKHPVVFDVPAPGRTPGRTIRVGTPICFEVTSSWVCRQLVFAPDGTRRADLLLSLTNDGWFNTFDPGRTNHLLSARWRCVELATPMVRAANTGISAAIGLDGKLIARSVDDRLSPAALPPRAAGVLTVDVPLGTSQATPFVRWGRWIGIVSPWVVLAAFLASFLRPRHAKTP